MKPKLLYIFIGFFIFLILLDVFLNIGVKDKLVSKEKKEQAISEARDNRQNMPIKYRQPADSNLRKMPSITVVKPVYKKEAKDKDIPGEEKKKSIDTEARQSAKKIDEAPAGSEGNKAVEEEPIGQSIDIIESGRNPTKEEKEDMNARGIIMY